MVSYIWCLARTDQASCQAKRLSRITLTSGTQGTIGEEERKIFAQIAWIPHLASAISDNCNEPWSTKCHTWLVENKARWSAIVEAIGEKQSGTSRQPVLNSDPGGATAIDRLVEGFRGFSKIYGRGPSDSDIARPLTSGSGRASGVDPDVEALIQSQQ